VHSKPHHLPTTPYQGRALPVSSVSGQCQCPAWCTSHFVVVWAAPSAKIPALPIEPRALVELDMPSPSRRQSPRRPGPGGAAAASAATAAPHPPPPPPHTHTHTVGSGISCQLLAAPFALAMPLAATGTTRRRSTPTPTPTQPVAPTKLPKCGSPPALCWHLLVQVRCHPALGTHLRWF
jgi:hypothetical protein